MNPPGTDAPTTPDLGTQLQRLLNNVVRVSEDARRPDLATAVHRELQRGPRQAPVVVVAGETKRGKSSLVNALLERPGLSPTGPGTVTNTFVAFSYSETPSMLVGLEAQADGTDGGIEELEVDITELDEWATIARNPANFKRVGSVQVRVPSTLLQSVVLVDTPGVGGLDSAHGLQALQAVQQADALVFTVDASAPLSLPELAFLNQAARRIDSITIAVTKTDLYRGWEQIVDDDRALLQRYAPALAGCRVLPVSSRMSEVALASDGADSARILEKSGYPGLRQVLDDRIVRRHDNLALANVMQVVVANVAELNHDVATRLAVASANPDLRRQLEEEDIRLQGLEAESAQWRTELSSGIDHARVAYQEDLIGGLARLRRAYEARISHAKADDRQKLPDELLADIVELTATLAEEVATTLEGLAVKLMGEVAGDSSLGSALAQTPGAVFDDTSGLVEQLSQPQLSRVEKLSSLVSFSSGRAIGSLGATTLPVVGLLGLPVVGVGLGFGVLFSAFMTKGRRELNQQTSLQKWLSDQLEEARRTVMTSFSHQMIDLQAELRSALNSYIKEQRIRSAELRGAAEQALREDGAQRASGRQRLEAQLALLGDLRSEAARILTLCESDRTLVDPK